MIGCQEIIPCSGKLFSYKNHTWYVKSVCFEDRARVRGGVGVGPFGTTFQTRIYPERKEQIEIRLDFQKIERWIFQIIFVKFFLSLLLHPGNWDRKSGSSSFRIWWKITSIFIASKPLVGFFWFFASIWKVTLGTFWWKPHVQKISGSWVMVQKPENWEFWSRFSNANILRTKRANRNPIGFSWRPKAVIFQYPLSNLTIFTPLDRKSWSKMRFSNGTEFTFPDNLSNISPVPVVESFWFFVSSKNLIVGSFW